MPTRDDVARLAGVSGASVARAFNQPEKLSESTRERIFAAAKALNYHPNYYGSVLRGKATKQLYVYCPELVNPFFLHVYFGMEQYALEQHYQIFLTRTFNRDMNLPFVISDFQDISRADIPAVGVNVEAAGYKAANHLFELGHDHIMFASAQIDPKWVGIQRCCNDNMRHASLFLLKEGDGIRNYFDMGAKCAKDIIGSRRLPTAIIAANDEIAVGLINGLSRFGCRVPEDVSVIGFDDAYIAAYSNPPLTTIHYPKARIGIEMARMLISMLNGQTTQPNITLETELVKRESTAAPRDESV